MVLIKEKEAPLTSLSPIPSLELEATGSSSSDDLSSTDDIMTSLSGESNHTSCLTDTFCAEKKNEAYHNEDCNEAHEHKDIKAIAKLLSCSMLGGYSFICRLSIVLVLIISWFHAHEVTGNDASQHGEKQQQEEDPWDTWGEGFDFDKQRNFWISDEDLPQDIANDLQSADEYIQREAMIRRLLDPSKWDTFDYWGIYHYFACDKLVYSSARPIWSEQLFRDTRDFYHEFVENDDTPFTGLFRSTHQANEDVYDFSQNAVPYLSGGEKGRGLKAARDIKEGDVIFKSTNNTIIFNDGHTMRKFLFSMNDRFSDPGMVCDILIWAWVQDMEGEVPFAGVVDLDNGNLLNDYSLGAYYGDNQEDMVQENSANVRCKGAALTCYASKDIAMGEELLGNYADFVSEYSWTNLGL